MSPPRLLLLVFIAVSLWGSVLAIGAYLGGPVFGHDARRLAIVLACVFGFLGVWGALLLFRRFRQRNKPLN